MGRRPAPPGRHAACLLLRSGHLGAGRGRRTHRAAALAPAVKPRLVVARDIAAAAAERFLQIAPRTVALAGGSTPRRLYQRLAGCAFPWPETEVFFGDERCVPPGHSDSNFRMATEALLASVSAKVHRMCGESCDAAAYEAELRAVFGDRLPAFDLVLLGLGEDGHTASLFPDDAALQEQERWVLVHRDCVSRHSPIEDAKLVRLDPTKGLDDISLSLEHPANVLNVSAYPGVVEALAELKDASDTVLSAGMTDGAARRHLPEASGKAAAALSAVHPGGKT
ncbi:MAG: 6-phosphogluconolactonase [Planctomycetes bacterium]|nr:6-phosphogluconolactonase [Planctomycetota bacterium]